MKKLYSFITILIIAALVIGCSTNNENTNENENKEDVTLVFGKTPWTSTVPPTEIAKIILEDMGYKVDEEEADVGVVFAGLGNGEIDIFMDYWNANHNKLYEKYDDELETLSMSYPEAEWGLAVPKYMEDVNDIGDLKGIEDTVNNEVIAIEAGEPAVEDVPKVIEEYGLDMEMVNSSEAAMIAEAKSKIDDEEPVVIFSWRPHSMFNHMDIKLLENSKATDYFIASDVSVVGHKSLKDKAPEAYEFLSNWSIDMEDIEEMIAKIEDGEDEKEVAQEWIDNNQDKVDEMLGK